MTTTEAFIPRMTLDEFRMGSGKVNERLVNFLQEHSFVVLTDIGFGETLYNEFISHFESFLSTCSASTKEKSVGIL